jgi:peptidoglycan hydrolase CwlO-like protein
MTTLKETLRWSEVHLKNAKTKTESAKLEKKIKDTKEKIAKLEAKKKGGRKTRRHTRRH